MCIINYEIHIATNKFHYQNNIIECTFGKRKNKEIIMNATNNYKKRVNNYKHDVCKMFLTQGLAKRKEGQIE